MLEFASLLICLRMAYLVVIVIKIFQPDIFLVVEDLLVPAPGSVLHIGQAANPATHLELQFLMVNLKFMLLFKLTHL